MSSRTIHSICLIVISFQAQLQNARYYFVGDEAFPLRENLQRPYPGKITTTRIRWIMRLLSLKIYLYLPSRRIVSLLFGLLFISSHHQFPSIFPNTVVFIILSSCVVQAREFPYRFYQAFLVHLFGIHVAFRILLFLCGLMRKSWNFSALPHHQKNAKVVSIQKKRLPYMVRGKKNATSVNLP